MDYNLLQAFMKVYEHMSFTKASEDLDISQAAVSQKIKKLEKELGKQLFVKKGRGIEATSYAEHMMSKLEPAARLVQEALEKEQFKVYVNETLVYDLNVDALLVDSPKSEEQIIEDLRTRKVDIAVDFITAQDASMAYEVITEEPVLVIASGTHPRVKGGISVTDYYQEQHIALQTKRINSDLINLITADPRSRDVVYRSNSIASQMLYTMNSDCLSLIPERMKSVAEKMGLQVFEAPFPIQKIPFSMVYHRNFLKDESHKLLRERIKAQLKR